MKAGIGRSARATTLLAGGLVTAVPALFGVAAMLALAVLCLAVVGLPWLPEAIAPLRAIATMERERAGRALGHPIPEPYRPLAGGWRQRGWTVLTDPATWRDLVWMLVHGFPGMVIGVVAPVLWPSVLYSLSIPFWWWLAPRGEVSAVVQLTTWPQALTLPVAQAAVEAALLWYLIPWLAGRQLWLSDLLLRPANQTIMAERIQQLTESRTGALAAHAAELRRIERDLHDGTQARLVSVMMRLGLAERSFASDPDNALGLLRDARDGVEEALFDLRHIIRGIYPPILSDRGLDGAIRALAAGHRIAVSVRIPGGLPRPPAAVEAGAYFVVAESITNIVKHSEATTAEVVVVRDRAELRVLVRDDGRGGADPDAGSGLSGIRRRVAALDGTTTIDSPPGQGTRIEVRLPCE